MRTLRPAIPALPALLALLLAAASTRPAPAQRPHIVLIMVDDMGFSDLGYHGGEIETPNLDALAHGGVRFSQFYNSGRCCPTRATLMTGLHPHQTGIGHMTQPPNSDRGKDRPPAYRGYLNRRCATIAEILRQHGYATLMAGKWHLGYNARDRWPLQRGFERYFGCISGATRFFLPQDPRGMTLGNDKVAEPESTTDEAFYTTDAFTDHAIRFIDEELKGAGRPTFTYLAYTAPHWPLQAFEDDIAKYRGKYREVGWDRLREQRHARQVENGLIDPSWKLSPRTPKIPAWDSLDAAMRDEMDLEMAVYAAMVDRVDQNVGKLVAFLKRAGVHDDTLIVFLSDNGGCQEGGMFGRGNFRDVDKRNEEHANSYGEAWANASNTPFRLYKHFAHEGGTATPFFMHWPARIRPRDDWYREPAQLIDVVPTILDVAGAEYPDRMHGNAIPPLDGVSLRPAFDGAGLGRSEPIFVEHENNAFVRDGRWKLVGRGVAARHGVDPARWELYDMVRDRTETRDLARERPELVQALAAKWDAWAARVGVYPKVRPPTPEPDPPQVDGRPLTVAVTVRHRRPHGVALAHGGNRFGYAVHFARGRPAFSVRSRGELTELVAPEPVSGRVSVVARLDADAMSISVGGVEVARGPSPGLLAGQPGIGLYLGQDFKDPVGRYDVPSRFNGKILSHRVDAPPPKVAMRTRWGAEVTADNVWREYPRPAFRRDRWINLNGRWQYAVTPKAAPRMPARPDGEILVPFAIEAPLSGVERRFTPEQALWYRRVFDLAKRGDRSYRLNFEAVDHRATVWLNGAEVGSHVGGNLPFSFDVSELAVDGANTLTVRVTDATDTGYQLHGKQRLNPRGIWYTPVSGIWQTVWIEEVAPTHLTGAEITPRIDGSVRVSLAFAGDVGGVLPPTRVTARLDGRVVASASGAPDAISLEIPEPKLWSPDSPTLYDLELRFGDDVVHSYVGLREVGRARVDGHWRLTLNGEPVFHLGTLDQGWWPDGLLTPPSDTAMRSDIEFLKAAGFNAIRKHIKVEPRRYYWHCDCIGIMVWQDHVSAMLGRDRPKWTRLAPDPPRVEWPEAAHAQFMAELDGMIGGLYNHPCIVQWVVFNERWGQHRTVEVGEWTVGRDPTRVINVASGGNFFPVGHVVDAHSYPHPKFPFEHDGGRFDGYVKVMGEFGGHGFAVAPEHLWSPTARNWGYGGLPKDRAEWLERYRTSMRMLADLRARGIAAGIYTQTTDVEGEINGLITYDRAVHKLPARQLAEIHAAAGLTR